MKTVFVKRLATRIDIEISNRLGRPLTVADFTGDGTVNLADFALWRDSLGATLNLLSDANADGVVNHLDYDRWRGSFGQTAMAGAAQLLGNSMQVSEPDSMAMSIFLVVFSLLLSSIKMR